MSSGDKVATPAATRGRRSNNCAPSRLRGASCSDDDKAPDDLFVTTGQSPGHTMHNHPAMRTRKRPCTEDESDTWRAGGTRERRATSQTYQSALHADRDVHRKCRHHTWPHATAQKAFMYACLAH